MFVSVSVVCMCMWDCLCGPSVCVCVYECVSLCLCVWVLYENRMDDCKCLYGASMSPCIMN